MGLDQEQSGVEPVEPAAEDVESGTKSGCFPTKKKKEKKPKEPEQKVPYFKLYSYADTTDKLLIALAIFGSVGSGTMLPLFAWNFGRFSNTFGMGAMGQDPQQFQADINELALSFVYIGIAGLVASYFQGAFWSLSATRQTNRLRTLYLSAVMRQDISYFDVHATTGGLLQGLNDDALNVQNGIGDKVGAALMNLTTFVAGYILSFIYGWDMTLVMVGMLPFLAAVGALLAKLTTTLTTRAQEAYSEANSIATQTLSQIRTVAAYNQEQRHANEYIAVLAKPLAVGITQGWMTGVSLGALMFIVFCSYAIALLYGAYRVAAGAMTGGDVLTTLFGSLIGAFALGQAGPNFAYFSKGQSSGFRLFSIIDRKPAIDCDTEDGDKPAAVVGEIELRNVKFAYPARPDALVFPDFSLFIPAGKTVALVGSSGSGKSTVVGLIERFYDPLSGTVLLDGRDLRSLNLRWLRTQVGLVNQEPTLFQLTIVENIRLGRPGASQEEVEAAAKAANAHNFISALPLGYNTAVGERGVQLSGGQKQRIAIARAILKNPKVLLLDEATSALDTASERVVQAALDTMVVGRTTVVVAHRLSTVKNADLIVVVQQGNLMEQGRHEELLRNTNGPYSILVQLQLQQAQQEAAVPEEEEDVDKVTVQAVPLAAEAEGARRRSGSLDLGKRNSLDKPGALNITSAAAPEAAVSGKKPKPYKVGFGRLLSLNKPELPYILVGMFAAVCAGVANPAFAMLFSTIIPEYYSPDPNVVKQAGRTIALYIFLVAIGAFLATFGAQACFSLVGENLAKRVRSLFIQAILRQEIGWFDLEENSSGILSSRLQSDASYVRGAVGDVLGLVMQNLGMLIFGYTVAFVYNWRMALVVTGAFPLIALGGYFQTKMQMGGSGASSMVYAQANQAVTEAFSAIRVVQAYNLQRPITDIYSGKLESVKPILQKEAQLGGVGLGYSQLSMFCTIALVVWFGGLEVTNNRSTFGDFLMAFLCLLFAAMGLAQSQAGFPDIGKASGAVERIFPIIDRKSKIDPTTEEGDKPGKVLGELALKDVTFAYPSRPTVTVFKSFSLTFPAGQTVALVGESGSGKSTVVGLIERFYDPLSGTVLLDGKDLRSYNVAWLRRHIGLVSQEPLLFSSSIRDNIAYGKPDATQEEIEAAARAGNAHDFISRLPDGYNTFVGERGVQLSGGQKQRVAIARAVVKDPRIMLLDEATSALDATSEQVVQAALDNIMQGRTSVVVAHRLSTVRNADLIAVVFRGTLLEQGTHDQLIAKPNGGYAKLVAAQMGNH